MIKRYLKLIGRPKESYLILMQVLSGIGFVYAFFADYDLKWWMISVFGYFCIFCLGITITYHRLMAHRSYHLWRPLEYMFALFANLGCTGSSVGWVFVHRTHHKYSDKNGDPHSPVIHGRLGAMIGEYGEGFDKWMVRDIINDGMHRFYHDYYNIMITAVPFFLLTIGGLEYLIFLFSVPVFLNVAASRMSNWIDHEIYFGTKAHHSNDSSRNVWWWGLLTFGEGWHNNHHAQPNNYQYGRRWFEVDMGKYVINFLCLFNLAHVPKVRNIK